MKKYCAWSVYTSFAIACAVGAEQGLPEPVSAVLERGPHHRVTETTSWRITPDGGVIELKGKQVELATGMHYRDGGAWLETREIIEPHPNGAVAHYGPHKAAFAANLNTRGAIQVVDADGKQFVSHILGVAFTDASSGQSVLIAPIKDSIGQILPPNQIVYSDAFVGIKCDVRYIYRRDGFEQDLILREALPVSPRDYGMDASSTRLEIFTEFIETPVGTRTEERLRVESDPVKRQTMALPDFIDQNLNFGGLEISKGRAIDFQGVIAGDIPVGKTWEVRDGRTFLIEAVELPSIQPALDALPQKQAIRNEGIRNARLEVNPKGRNTMALAARAESPATFKRERNGTIRTVRPFPAAPRQQAAVQRQPMKQLASLNLRPGVLFDYMFTMPAGVTNFLFRPEATHSVSGTVNLYGTNTIVGGTIVKYAAGGVLSFNGTIVCDTTPYHPAVFTASTDSTMGDTVAGGSPSGYYATAALRASSNVVGELHDLRFSYAATAIDWTGSQERFYNLQFINCSNAIRRVGGTNAPVHNVLATNVLYIFTGSNSTFNAQHMTANRVGTLVNVSGTPSKLTLTNSILVNVTNAGTGTIELDYIATNGTASLSAPGHGWPASSSDFQISVGGYHYLATNSALHDVGTTTIAANLLSELRSLTTYAPTLLNNTAQVSVTLSPIAWRDTDDLDLGYHYPPLDYILRGYRLNTNVVLTMTNGVAIGVDYNGQSWGLIFDTATNISIGSPASMNRIVRAHNVQERSTGNPGTRAMLYDIGDSGTHGNSEARYRFTEFAAMAADGYALYTGKNWINWEWSHSWIYNQSIVLNANKGGQTVGVTNSIFEWSNAAFQRSGASSAFHFRNNLFRHHNLNVSDLNSSSTFRDNLIDNGIVYSPGTSLANSHNAYYLATNQLPGSTGGDVVLGSLTYQTDPYGKFGLYGRYYQPAGSSLLNVGSQNATNAGLFHFTTTTNQVKETNSVVDIGPHYVALASNGNLFDYDADGVPDYYEDRNGNGTWESGELNWQNGDTDGDGVGDGVELLQGRNPMGGTLSDTNNLLNLRVFTPLK